LHHLIGPRDGCIERSIVWRKDEPARKSPNRDLACHPRFGTVKFKKRDRSRPEITNRSPFAVVGTRYRDWLALGPQFSENLARPEINERGRVRCMVRRQCEPVARNQRYRDRAAVS
jgi:hypothetical protein